MFSEGASRIFGLIHSMKRKGIILAGGTGTRLYPLTIAVSKQLMPIYDKPMIYYPLSVLMLAGIRDILIISTPEDRPLFQRQLGDGSDFGVQLHYEIQPKPEGLAQAYHIGADFVGSSPSCLILGDNLFYGSSFIDVLAKADRRQDGATIFSYRVADPTPYGVVEFDEKNRAVSLEEKPQNPRSSWAVPGLYFYDGRAVEFARGLKPSARGEWEITDLNLRYLHEGALYVQPLGRGTAWLDTGTHDNLINAADYVRVIQNRQGLKIACHEEIAHDKNWITTAQLMRRAEAYGKSSYGEYLRMIVRDKRVG
jgi:glucose-1-phosphate thymidylyltransferase